MGDLVALDVAVLPPPDVTARAIALSAALPAAESRGLRLDADHLPHVTLMQLFARAEEVDQVVARAEEVARHHGPLHLQATGGGQGANAVSIGIEKTPPLLSLHEQLLESLRGLERPDGGTGAFFDPDARLRDVLWVAGYRLTSSVHQYAPHITLGHGSTPPHVEPFSFTADTVAVCHLGKFCACRRVLRQWSLLPQ